MSRIITFLITICAACAANAQSWQWGRGSTSACEGVFAATDPLGDIFAGGYTEQQPNVSFGNFTLDNPGNHYEGFVLKYDANGNVVWLNGCENGDNWVVNMAADLFGNLYVIYSSGDSEVTFGSTTIRNPSPLNDYMSFVVKYDVNGSISWVRKLDFVDANSLATDGNGNVYVYGSFSKDTVQVGSVRLKNIGDGSIFLTKLDSTGRFMWTTGFGDSGQVLSGPISVTAGGNIYFAGMFNTGTLAFGSYSLSMGPWQVGIFLTKMDTYGNVTWAQSAGGNQESITVMVP